MNRYRFVSVGGQQSEADGDSIVEADGVTRVMSGGVAVLSLESANVISHEEFALGDTADPKLMSETPVVGTTSPDSSATGGK